MDPTDRDAAAALGAYPWAGPPLPGGPVVLRDYHLFHAARLLEARLLRQFPGARGLGEWGAAAEVPLRLRPSTYLGHPATDVEDIRWRAVPGRDGPSGERWVAELTSYFLGLTGATSPLPRWFLFLLRRHEDSAAREFLDIFHHRLLSLRYRTWKRHRSEHMFTPGGRDALSRALLDMVGVAPQATEAQLGMAPQRVLRYLALLSLRSRPALGLQLLLREELGVPLQLFELAPRVLQLDASARSVCPHLSQERQRGGRLGRDFLLGARRTDVMGALRLRVGPVPYATYLALRRGGALRGRLLGLLRLYLRQPLGVVLEVQVPAAEVGALQLGHAGPAQGLGQAACAGAQRGRWVEFTMHTSIVSEEDPCS